MTLSAMVLGVSACGGDDESATDDPTSAASSTASGTGTEGEDAETGETGQTGEGETDQAAFIDRMRAGLGDEGSAHVALAVKAPSAGIKAEGDTTYGPDGSEMQLTMRAGGQAAGQTGGQEITLVVDDGTAYMSLAGVTPSGKFFEIPANSPVLESLNTGSLSPAESIKGFEAGLQEVEDLGSEEIGGEPVEHYELTLDAAKTLAATGTKEVPGLPKTLTYDVWLDEQDRMRRATYELSGVEVVMDLTDWGKDITIDPPAKADLVEAPPGL